MCYFFKPLSKKKKYIKKCWTSDCDPCHLKGSSDGLTTGKNASWKTVGKGGINSVMALRRGDFDSATHLAEVMGLPIRWSGRTGA